MLATTAMVKISETDAAKGSDYGVDDHSRKLPGTTEPTLCAWVASCCVVVVAFVFVVLMSCPGDTASDDALCIAWAGGAFAESIPKEHVSSYSPPEYLEEASVCECTTKDARDIDDPSELCITDTYACMSC